LGCDTVGGCVYQKDGTSDRFCFKMGGLETPGCEQKPCDEYVVISDGNEFFTESVDVNSTSSTCTLPSFGVPARPTYGTPFLYKSGQDFYTKHYSNKKQPTVRLLSNGSMQTIETSENDSDFADKDYGLAPSKSRGLLAVGGILSKPGMRPYNSDSVYQLTNGAWTKMSLTLMDAISFSGFSYSCDHTFVTDDDTKLITVGGLINGGVNAYNKLNVYTIATGAYLSKPLSAYVTSCAFVDNVVYFEDESGSFSSYDVAKLKLSQISSPSISSGFLANFRGKLAIFGGKDGAGNHSEVIKVFDNDNWDTEIAYSSDNMRNARSVTYVNK